MKISRCIAQSIKDSGAEIVSCVPGFGGTEVFDSWIELNDGKPVYSFHEEVAFAVAHGAAIAGSRSVLLTKAHGLAKAANAAVDALYAGLNAGMLIMVFHDEDGRHSDNIFDIEPFIKGLRYPLIEPDTTNIEASISQAFVQSEELQLPIILLLNSKIVNEEKEYQLIPHGFIKSHFSRDVHKNLVVPIFAKYQFDVVNAKLQNRNWENIEKPGIPKLPDGLPPNYAAIVKGYMPLFDVLKTLRGDIVFGDTGVSTLFALPPYDCVDACAYMGGSIPMAIGAYLAGYKNTWAITGDFSFIAAGQLGLIEARQREIPLKVIIFNNQKAQTTGGQNIRSGTLQLVLEGYKDSVLEIDDPSNREQTEKVLSMVARSKKLQIVVANYIEGE